MGDRMLCRQDGEVRPAGYPSAGSVPGPPARLFGPIPITDRTHTGALVTTDRGYSPPGKRPHSHALSSAIPAAEYLGIPTDTELIKAVMRGILSAILAKMD